MLAETRTGTEEQMQKLKLAEDELAQVHVYCKNNRELKHRHVSATGKKTSRQLLSLFLVYFYLITVKPSEADPKEYINEMII